MATVPADDEEGGDGASADLTGRTEQTYQEGRINQEQGSEAQEARRWQPASPRVGAEEASSAAKHSHDSEVPQNGQSTSAVELTGSNEVDEDAITYSLELPQQPTRGRTCGFGDADRRALTAPLIARLRVFRNGVEQVPEDIDTAFLVCAVDLWSADGSEDCNLVRHPSYQIPRPPPSSSGPLLPPSPAQAIATPYVQAPPLPPGPASRMSPSSLDSLLAHASHQGGTEAGPSSILKRPSEPEIWPAPDAAPSGLYHPTEQPRRNSIRFSDQEGLEDAHSLPPASFPHAYTSPTNHTFAFQAPIYHPDQSEPDRPSLSRRRSSQVSAALPQTASSASMYPRPWTGYSNRPSTAATSVGLAPSGSVGPPGTASGFRPSTAIMPSVGSDSEYACVKNLVGALTVNGHVLRIPNEQLPGVFFVFHDLSVRTEGTFTIRLRLLSIGSIQTGLYSGVMPVLCTAFTRPFEVMSAKKFPGMLDPTLLSQAFAKQGLRIPTRKGANRKRRKLLDPRDADNGDNDMDPSPIPEEHEPSHSPAPM